MIAVVLFAPMFALLLLFALALSGRNRPSERTGRWRPRRRPRIESEQLHALIVALLDAMGFAIETDIVHGSAHDPSQRLVAVEKGALTEARHIVFIEARPPFDLVEPTSVLELAEQVKTEAGATGILITPYAIDRSGVGGIEVPIELIDGARLRQLVILHLPTRLGELDQHGIGLPEELLPPRRSVRTDLPTAA